MDIAKMRTSDISWSRLGRAVDHYTHLGYKYIETPWKASDEAVSITCDPEAWKYRVREKVLVGSAEQGFLDLEIQGKLARGRYISCGPCFRDEAWDALHQEEFMKVELYSTYDPDQDVKSMIKLALEFFKKEAGPTGKVEKVETEIGWDIEVNGIEVGSYGVREFNGIRWAYGTAVAEPRFSTARRYF